MENDKESFISPAKRIPIVVKSAAEIARTASNRHIKLLELTEYGLGK